MGNGIWKMEVGKKWDIWRSSNKLSKPQSKKDT